MRRAWRTAVCVVVFALIGAAATVFIAWAAVARSHWTPQLTGNTASSGWNSPPFKMRALRWGEQTDYGPLNAARGLGFDAHHGHLTPFPQDIDRARMEGIEQWFVSVLHAGLPLRAMCSEHHEPVRPQNGFVAFRPPVWTGLTVPAELCGDFSVIPVAPLWPGFLVDTAFWGGAALVVWSVPGFVRRRARRRRGRCVRCEYELPGVAVCPECGGAP